MADKWEEKQYTPTFLGPWREATGVTQEEMANAIDISNGHLSKLELGKRQYTQEILEKARDFIRAWYPEVTVCDLILVDPKDFARAQPSDKARAAMMDQARRVPEEHWAFAARMLAGMTQPTPENTTPPTKTVARISPAKRTSRQVR